MSGKKEDSLPSVLTWMIKVLVGLYGIIIVFGSITALLFDVNIDGSILASITALLTTAMGGLIAAAIRRSGGKNDK